MPGWKLFAIVVPIFMLIDLLYLGVIMKNFYSQELGELARRRVSGELAPRWGAAILVYVLIPAGLVLFVRPLLGESATFLHALGWGAVFGLVMYGVYDLTCLSVIDKWTVRMTIADIAWGCVLCGVNSAIMLRVDRWLS